MFITYCLALLLLVYIAPALALYPKLILSTRTVVATPFISIAVVALIQALLAASGNYNHIAVVSLSSLLLAIAAIRVYLLMTRQKDLVYYWPNTHRLLLILCIILGAYWAAQLGSTGFDTDDEIYSWNMWALQHHQNEAIDFYYTGAAYPQLFPIVISYCYQLLGSIELQLPVKVLFSIFPIALWAAIAVAPKEPTLPNALQSIIILLLLFTAIGQFFGVGLADPLMASSLTIAIYLFIQYTEKTDQPVLLVLSVVCAAVAFYTKQQALIWALFSFPIITLIATMRHRLSKMTLLASGSLLLFGLAWVFGDGSGFQNNQGVLAASQEGRNAIEQLIFAIKKYTIEQPLVPLFIVASIVIALKKRHSRDITFVFLVPGLIAWLLYGAYGLRLGIHIIAVSALLIAMSNITFPIFLNNRILALKNEKTLQRGAIACIVVTVCIVGFLSTQQINKNIKLYGNHFNLYLSGENTISKFFGRDSEFIFKELYNRPDLLLWVPSPYIYGVFYSHTPMIRPAQYRMTAEQYNVSILLAEIKLRRPNYLFDAGQWVDYSPASGVLRELAEQRCTYLFEKVGRRNKYGYVLYRLQNDDALIEQCSASLQQQNSQ